MMVLYTYVLDVWPRERGEVGDNAEVHVFWPTCQLTEYWGELQLLVAHQKSMPALIFARSFEHRNAGPPRKFLM